MFNLPHMTWPTRGLAFSIPALAAMVSVRARRRAAPRGAVTRPQPMPQRIWRTASFLQQLGVSPASDGSLAAFLEQLHALSDAEWRRVAAVSEATVSDDSRLDALVTRRHLALARWIVRDEITSALQQARLRGLRLPTAGHWDACWASADRTASALLVADTLSTAAFHELTKPFVGCIPEPLGATG